MYSNQTHVKRQKTQFGGGGYITLAPNTPRLVIDNNGGSEGL